MSEKELKAALDQAWYDFCYEKINIVQWWKQTMLLTYGEEFTEEKCKEYNI